MVNRQSSALSSQPSKDENYPIGILDSGVGGLSVLRHVQALLPHERLLYFADQAHIPYGPRPAEVIYRFSEEITRFLLAQQAKIIVVACNTASAAALTRLRTTFTGVPFVGMEPAVKPGAAQTRNGKVGVLATAGTFRSQRYAHLTAQFARGVQVFEDPCPGLVEQIEAGLVDSPETEVILWQSLAPMLAAGVDTLVLGCTHYPFVTSLIERIAGPAVTIIDPAPAVARQTQRVLEQRGLLAKAAAPGPLRAFTTGNVQRLADLATKLLAQPITVAKAVWQDDELSLTSL